MFVVVLHCRRHRLALQHLEGRRGAAATAPHIAVSVVRLLTGQVLRSRCGTLA